VVDSFVVFYSCTLQVVALHLICSLNDLSVGSQAVHAAAFLQPFRNCSQLLHHCLHPLVVRVCPPSGPGRLGPGPTGPGPGPGSTCGDVSGLSRSWVAWGTCPGGREGIMPVCLASVGPGPPEPEGDLTISDGSRGEQPLGLWGVWASPVLSSLCRVTSLGGVCGIECCLTAEALLVGCLVAPSRSLRLAQ
jgi:hypothetical protein